jgi:tetratricopeptide (TPR) repeat protein
MGKLSQGSSAVARNWPASPAPLGSACYHAAREHPMTPAAEDDAARRGSVTRSVLVGMTLATLVLGGCATTYVQGASAYRAGRYDEAADHFAAVLASQPDRLDAQVGLGLARYKLGDWDGAIEHLGAVVARVPRHATARLFLGLAHLRRGDDGPADEHLSAFRDLRADPGVSGLVDRALHLLRGDPLTRELREYITASLEGAAEWQRELRETRQALRDEELRRLRDDRIIYVVPRSRCRC